MPTPSTRQPSLLPSIDDLLRFSQSLAMLDAALMPEWADRYYSFNAHWKEGEMMASMRDGSGDDYFIWFSSAGAVLKGFAHESTVWKRLNGKSELVLTSLAEQLPPELAPFLQEPAFSIAETTFCLWRQPLDTTWFVWQPPVERAIRFLDGSTDLLMLLDGNPETYRDLADESYDIRPGRASVQAVYDHKPLTKALLKRLGSPRDKDELATDQAEIGY